MKIEDIIKTSKTLKLSKQIVTNLLYTGSYVNLQLNTALKPYGITLQQFNVLRILRGQNGNPLNLSDVQQRMINNNSNTTRLIDKLVTKNYVERAIDPENRRKINISITEDGLKCLSKLDRVIDKDEEEKIVSNLSKKECLMLNSILEKIRKNNID